MSARKPTQSRTELILQACILAILVAVYLTLVAIPILCSCACSRARDWWHA